MKIEIILTNGDKKYHTLPFGLRYSEIYGWVCDKYGSKGYWNGWKEFNILSS